MQVKFNPTGTHIHKGFLKVRLDLYPDVGDKTYSIHYVEVPVIPPEGYQGKVDKFGLPVDHNAYDIWIDSLPKVWRTNACLYHFVKIDPNATAFELQALKASVFTKSVMAEIDDAFSKDDMAEIKKIARARLGSGIKVKGDKDQVVLDINSRLVSLESIN